MSHSLFGFDLPSLMSAVVGSVALHYSGRDSQRPRTNLADARAFFTPTGYRVTRLSPWSTIEEHASYAFRLQADEDHDVTLTRSFDGITIVHEFGRRTFRSPAAVTCKRWCKWTVAKRSQTLWHVSDKNLD